jgi:hypothetical protein
MAKMVEHQMENINIMFPSEWHHSSLQYRLSRVGIVAPINSSGLQDMYPGLPLNKTVYVPFIADDSIKLFWEKTGGNPLADVDKNKLCIIVSPIVHGIRYNEVFYGCLDEGEDQAHCRPLPPYFEENVEYARSLALKTLDGMTEQKYEVLATKLNPLSSGRCNLVMFARFAYECPFDRQFYTPVPDALLKDKRYPTKVRIIPRPLVNRFGEPEPGLKLTFKFLYVDKDMFSQLYHVFQNFVEHKLEMHFRYMKVDEQNNTINVYAQHVAGKDKKVVTDFKYSLQPFVLIGWEQADITI